MKKERLNYKRKKGRESPYFVDHTGEKFITKEGYEVEIIEYFTNRNCTIRFNDGGILYNIRYENVKNRGIRNPNHRTVYGIGYMGYGKYTGVKGTKAYSYWRGILQRCYDPLYLSKKPAYKDCSVGEYWHNYQNFGAWFEENFNPKIMKGWNLDKDILLKGSRTYSLETCCFVPCEINNLFVKNNATRGEYPVGVTKKGNKFVATVFKNGVNRNCGTYNTPEQAFQAYKTAKEAYIKEIADKWKELIDPRVYEAMYNYKVEITD